MPENSTPVFKMYTTAELRAERQELLERMRPFNLEQMHRLYDADLLSVEESEMLDNYRSLAWLIDGEIL
ncbi:hypothetical protein A583_14673 [Corynebacterium glutamicum Z188]|uniref:Uncharacterized protein n=1 Tax=Corynebacterium glutamicum TaxID=1718 RepID=A0AB36ICH0_CORGT|nr:hypothetical protein [Corynebacterium glutamicum]MRT18301.1 hypothetical protein [Aequorivita lutea]AGN20593.1 hypothetical protein C624_15150 [Corynebacterium glutamicum SCgG1]AGN23618.1 hypothetical protein C629_15160 [Corynebacterium glutamicum SCgG2]EGV41180.1 hypothetical protein CgS9114_04225 [Corynebacterium glutamicum S9114]EPP39309.1 hypothetical protein A583_14673 [Corynebacterium glutamicum Z188]